MPGLLAARGCFPSRRRRSPADRHCRSGLARPGDHRARLAHCRDLQDRRIGRHDVSAQLDRGAAVQSMLPVVSCVVQDLEHGDRRRQSLHGAAGGTDDLADRGARWRVHDLDAGRRRAARCGARFRVGAAAQRARAGRTASRSSTCRSRRCAGARPSGRFRSARSAAPAALLIGTLSPDGGDVHSDRHGGDAASDPAVVSRHADARRAAREARSRYSASISITTTFTASPAWRRHMTLQFAEEIRAELAGKASGMTFLVNGKSAFRRVRAPDNACAPFCAISAVSA